MFNYRRSRARHIGSHLRQARSALSDRDLLSSRSEFESIEVRYPSATPGFCAKIGHPCFFGYGRPGPAPGLRRVP
jgi:hypothetical protein